MFYNFYSFTMNYFIRFLVHTIIHKMKAAYPAKTKIAHIKGQTICNNSSNGALISSFVFIIWTIPVVLIRKIFQSLNINWCFINIIYTLIKYRCTFCKWLKKSQIISLLVSYQFCEMIYKILIAMIYLKSYWKTSLEGQGAPGRPRQGRE